VVTEQPRPGRLDEREEFAPVTMTITAVTTGPANEFCVPIGLTF